MPARWTVLAVAALGALLGFLLGGSAPLGSMLWPPADGPRPEGANLVLLMGMAAVEATAFGIGVAFLAFGYPAVRRAVPSPGMAVAAHLSLAWLFVNWVPHTALHMAHGNILTPDDFTGLVAIEYGFHFTLILAAATLLVAGRQALRARGTPAASPKATSTAAGAK